MEKENFSMGRVIMRDNLKMVFEKVRVKSHFLMGINIKVSFLITCSMDWESF